MDKICGTEVGLGWSTKSDSKEATNEALNMALAGKKCKTPHFAIIFSSLENDSQTVLKEARRFLGNKTKIYGGVADPIKPVTCKTSGKPINNKGNFKKGYLSYEKTVKGVAKGVVAMTVTSTNIFFGVGSADLSAFHSSCEAVKVAILKAMQNAGKKHIGPPKVVLFTSSIEDEEQFVDCIKKVAGKSVVICGNSPLTEKFSVFAETETYKKGVSMAVIYTNLPIGGNIIQKTYRKVNKPEAIKSLLVMR
ncbi:MAG: FIST N-terminal domain-containing protein [Candidatus Omnitrophota bacterium]